MNFRILQLRDIRLRTTGYSFMSYEFAKKNGFSLEDYKEVYSFTEDTIAVKHPEDLMIDGLLNTIFRFFNRVVQEDADRLDTIGYHGHSLSVSDIVEVDGTKYYCDSFGWEKI